MNSKNPEKARTQHLITKESLRTSVTRSKTPSAQASKDNLTELNGQVATEQTATAVPEKITKPRCRRQWEQWSWDEKKCFYEGLAEYGKDYNKIRTFMNKKLKNKSYNDGKTKEQIRFFYHRTWSKISKTLNLQPESDSKKACRRELHYLLCLGELNKKRSTGIGDKVMKQLHDLATKGLTYIRQNGRNLRVRPPNRSLRKIYKDISDIPEIVLPKTVNIEFLPNSNTSFNFVQKHAFNPRIRFTGVNINAKFSELFDMLNKRFTDFCTNEKLELRIFPMQSNKTNKEISKMMTQAVDSLENFEKTQDTDIVVEKEEEPKDDKIDEDILTTEIVNKKRHDQLSLEEVLPNFFAEHNESNLDVVSEPLSTKDVNYFPGYWTHEDGKLIYLRVLFVAFEQKQTLKFKYEWRQPDVENEKSSFSTTSLEYLTHLCNSTSSLQLLIPQSEMNFNIASPQVHSPQIQSPLLHSPLLHSPNIVFEQPTHQPMVSGISTHQPGMGVDSFGIPLRPRPGRRRVISQSKFGINNLKNTTSPILHPTAGKISSTKSLRNAVAVNLIPHPPQLVQFAQLPPDATRLVNSSAGAGGVRQEVINEGFQEHFQSLNNMIKSSALVKEMPQTPKKVNSIPVNVPPSPNLEWLNETVDISLTSFLNVCDMQLLQSKGINVGQKQGFVKSEQANSNNHHEQKQYGTGKHVMTDPVLPEFESSEASQGPLYGLSFELSNQNALKPTNNNNNINNNQFSLS